MPYGEPHGWKLVLMIGVTVIVTALGTWCRRQKWRE
jgi:cytochrome oxidase assembly protein ShyY1